MESPAPEPVPGYLLDNRQPPAARRLAVLAALLDPVTFRHLAGTGIGPGWRCWEVGAGSPSVPGWLADRVGPSGRVLATDLEPRLVAGDGRYDVRRHDVAAEPPPLTGLDLVHARLVLVHVPDRDRALAAMTGALRPGGWLVVEDADPELQPLACPDEHGPEQRLANRLRRGFRALLADRDADLAYGRTLPRRLREAGLVDVVAQVWAPLAGPDCVALERATVEQVRDRVVGAGLATDAEVEAHLANLAAGRLPDVTTAPLVSACGRRPS